MHEPSDQKRSGSTAASRPGEGSRMSPSTISSTKPSSPTHRHGRPFFTSNHNRNSAYTDRLPATITSSIQHARIFPNVPMQTNTRGLQSLGGEKKTLCLATIGDDLRRLSVDLCSLFVIIIVMDGQRRVSSDQQKKRRQHRSFGISRRVSAGS